MHTYRATAYNKSTVETSTRVYTNVDELRTAIIPYLGSAEYVIIERSTRHVDWKPIGMCFAHTALPKLHGTQLYNTNMVTEVQTYYASYWRAEDNTNVRVKYDSPYLLYTLSQFGTIAPAWQNYEDDEGNHFIDYGRHKAALDYADYITRR